MNILDFKNFNLVPGIPSKIEFDLIEDTFIHTDVSLYTFKLEVLNQDLTLRFTSTEYTIISLGKIQFLLLESDTLSIGTGLFQYRLIAKDTSGFPNLSFKGFFEVDEPFYVESGTPTSGNTILPDGSIYLGSATTLVPNTWYAISSYYRLIITGIGRVVLDLRNNIGTTFIAVEVFNNETSDPIQWIPDMGQNSSFRISTVFGTPSAKYLP